MTSWKQREWQKMYWKDRNKMCSKTIKRGNEKIINKRLLKDITRNILKRKDNWKQSFVLTFFL